MRVITDDDLPANRSLMVLDLATGGGTVTTTKALAPGLGLTAESVVTRSQVDVAIAEAGITMNNPEALFYLPIQEQSVLERHSDTPSTRQLTSADTEAFAQLATEAPPDDVDEAFVELDHWLVYGTFVEEHLVCVASMYPWSGTTLADLGVITLPQHRSRGLAAQTVRAMSAAALRLGYEPQYRCQLDNRPSMALATAAGFSRFATWHVIEDTN